MDPRAGARSYSILEVRARSCSLVDPRAGARSYSPIVCAGPVSAAWTHARARAATHALASLTHPADAWTHARARAATVTDLGLGETHRRGPTRGRAQLRQKSRAILQEK